MNIPLEKCAEEIVRKIMQYDSIPLDEEEYFCHKQNASFVKDTITKYFPSKELNAEDPLLKKYRETIGFICEAHLGMTHVIKTDGFELGCPCCHRDESEQEVKFLTTKLSIVKTHLRDANRGAEINSKIAVSTIKKRIEIEEEIKLLKTELSTIEKHLQDTTRDAEIKNRILERIVVSKIEEHTKIEQEVNVLKNQNSLLYDFINKEVKMTGCDTKIADLKMRLDNI